MLKKVLLPITIVIYSIGLLYGIINSRIDLLLLFSDFNVEKTLFSLYNLYIILILILIAFKIIKNKFNIYKTYIYSLIGYILFHISYFIWKVYEILVLYNLKMDSKLLIANAVISPSGLLPNLIILLILLQLSLNFRPEK